MLKYSIISGLRCGNVYILYLFVENSVTYKYYILIYIFQRMKSGQIYLVKIGLNMKYYSIVKDQLMAISLVS